MNRLIELAYELSDGKIFKVIFIKRTTGEFREMSCRRGVTKELLGGDLPYDPLEKNLLTVYDLEKQAYRTIPFEGIREVHHHGKVEKFNQEKKAA